LSKPLLQVFKEAATYRGKLKDTCLSLLSLHYRAELQEAEVYKNQLELQNAIQDNIEDLLERLKFHLGPELEGSDVGSCLSL